MIEGVGSIRTVGTAALSALAFTGSEGARIALPVRPALAPYALFKHIRAVPDSSLKNGIPMYKLAILDRLIERLSSSASSGRAREVTTANIDDVITDLSREFRTRSAIAFRGGALPDTGLVVDLVA